MAALNKNNHLVASIYPAEQKYLIAESCSFTTAVCEIRRCKHETVRWLFNPRRDFGWILYKFIRYDVRRTHSASLLHWTRICRAGRTKRVLCCPRRGKRQSSSTEEP